MPQSDCYYTPPWIADEVADRVTAIGAGCDLTVADYAVGEGSLLAAVEKQWPDVTCLGVDIDSHAVARLKRQYPRWTVGRCDMLSATSRLHSPILQTTVDFAVLNPPFSARGGARVTIRAFDETVSCSPPMAFALLALERVRAEGSLLAVLPANAMRSKKDEQARRVFAERSTFDIVARFAKRSFKGAVTETLLLQASPSSSNTYSSVYRPRSGRRSGLPPVGVALVRGVVGMHRAQSGPGALPLIHTTDMKKGAPVRSSRRAVSTRIVNGPMILIPRVGSPNVNKVVSHTAKGKMTLSDCVFALVCTTESDQRVVHERIENAWTLLSAEYQGSCAPYLTVEGLTRFLSEINVNPTVLSGKACTTKASAPAVRAI